MRIGEAARSTGLTVKAIRHYESVGLLRPMVRCGAYRDVSAADLRTLQTIAHCRSLGFNVEEVRGILELVRKAHPACPDPREMSAMVEARIAETRGAIAELAGRLDSLTQVFAYVRSRAE